MMTSVIRAFAAAFLPLALAASAYAAPPTHATPLNWGSQIQCSTDGDLVVNVTLQVTGDMDSGVGGNYWADDTSNKTIQLWTTPDDGVYCARVMYLGKFVAVAGASPNNTGTLIGGEKGSFEGGYWATITGALLSTPTWRTNGHVGTINLGCDVSTGSCTNPVSWVDQYFVAGAVFEYGWWGWTYHGGKNGSWVNASAGNSGDIKQQ